MKKGDRIQVETTLEILEKWSIPTRLYNAKGIILHEDSYAYEVDFGKDPHHPRFRDRWFIPKEACVCICQPSVQEDILESARKIF